MLRVTDLEVLPGRFSIVKLPTAAHGAVLIGQPASQPAFLAVTDKEISLVCPTRAVPRTALAREDGWSLMRLPGEWDFRLVGVLAALTAALAQASVPVFAASTFETDYLLVKTANLERAARALAEAGIAVHTSPTP
ncbi:MAG: ACT domain-containing protein [Bifidobacteriaceae bacterium]|jgi:hypothetical protein|nr:ACT domain-containing protein [Bifidobacteriaceae bacterium]